MTNIVKLVCKNQKKGIGICSGNRNPFRKFVIEISIGSSAYCDSIALGINVMVVKKIKGSISRFTFPIRNLFGGVFLPLRKVVVAIR
jgi:hypothetical protein